MGEHSLGNLHIVLLTRFEIDSSINQRDAYWGPDRLYKASTAYFEAEADAPIFSKHLQLPNGHVSNKPTPRAAANDSTQYSR